MLVGLRDSFDVLGRYLLLRGIATLGDALAQNFGLGLKINHEIGDGRSAREHIEIALVKFQLFVVEIDVGENFVLLEKKIADDHGGIIVEAQLGKLTIAFHEEMHLGAKSGTGFLGVKLGEEGIVFGIEDAAGVEAVGQDFGERGFAYADGAFDGDPAERLEGGLGHGAGIIAEEFTASV